MTLGERYDPRDSHLPVGLTFLGGLLIHAIDQLLHFRAGPIPILITAPSVAVLAYLYVRPETRIRWLVVLLCWGAVGSGLALLGVFLLGSSYQLPRSMTDQELVLFDLGSFLWFVVTLAGAYAVAARRIDSTRGMVAATLTGPLLQFAWMPVFIVLVEVGQYV